MLRYCAKCQKEYDFDPVKISGSEELHCPTCGSIISKNSRKPVDHTATEKMEKQIGDGIGQIMHFSYIFYGLIAIIGIIGYVLQLDNLVYIMTGISMVVFFFQLLSGRLIFRWGVILLPAGAVAGYFILGQRPIDACLGILVVFLLRHIIRRIILRFIGWLVNLGNK